MQGPCISGHGELSLGVGGDETGVVGVVGCGGGGLCARNLPNLLQIFFEVVGVVVVVVGVVGVVTVIGEGGGLGVGGGVVEHVGGPAAAGVLSACVRSRSAQY